jgi:hypothetical protein
MTYPDGRHADQAAPHIEVPRQRATAGWLGQPEPAPARTPGDERFAAPERQSFAAPAGGGQPDTWSPPPTAWEPQAPPPPANWEQQRPAAPAAWEPPRATPSWNQATGSSAWEPQRGTTAWDQPTGMPAWEPEPGPVPREQPDNRHFPRPGPDTPPEPPRVPGPESAAGPDLPALLRGRVVDRLLSINASHAGHAADNIRSKDDLCEHAVALFSVDSADGSHTLSTATRLSLSDSSNAHLLDVLTSLNRVVEQKLAEAAELGRPWDPRTPLTGLVNRSETLHRSMTYIGVGISTLDTPEQPWRQMKTSIDRHSGLHLRGQGYLYLSDGTTVHFVRAAQLGGRSGQHQITADRVIHSQYQYRRNSDMLAYANQRTFLVWEQLRRLHQLLATATQA